MEENIKKVEKLLMNFNNLILAAETKEFIEGPSKELEEMDKLIILINESLDFIMYDKYYEIIEYFYLQNKDINSILKIMNISRDTFFMNKRKLLIKLTDFIYSDDYIKNLKRELVEEE